MALYTMLYTHEVGGQALCQLQVLVLLYAWVGVSVCIHVSPRDDCYNGTSEWS